MTRFVKKLQVWVSRDEAKFLTDLAEKREMTTSFLLRQLIREAKEKEAKCSLTSRFARDGSGRTDAAPEPATARSALHARPRSNRSVPTVRLLFASGHTYFASSARKDE